jgi:hypothetical protein
MFRLLPHRHKVAGFAMTALLAASAAQADVDLRGTPGNRPACVIKVEDPEPLPDAPFSSQQTPQACEIPSSGAAPQVLPLPRPLQLQPRKLDEQKRTLEAPK